MLWPIMTTISEREFVSVTTMRSRLADQGFPASRAAVRRGLKRLAKHGILAERRIGRHLYGRPRERWGLS